MTQITAKKLLVLDLDETLIYATEQPMSREVDFTVGQYFVYKRPFLNEFLAYCFENFDVGVWTTSTASYASAVIDNITERTQNLQFVWARDRCTWAFDEQIMERVLTKKLDKLRKRGFGPESIIVIDDTAVAWRSSYGNLVNVTRFEGDESDDELGHLPEYLELLKDHENIRSVEKRNWRARIR